jgi:hypothetical protein
MAAVRTTAIPAVHSNLQWVLRSSLAEFGRCSHKVLCLWLAKDARQGNGAVRIGRQMQHQRVGVLQVCNFVMDRKWPAWQLCTTVAVDWTDVTRTLAVKVKGKAVPLQVWTGPKGSRKLRLPDFVTTAKDGSKVVSLMHRPRLPPGNNPGTHFC